MKAQHFVDGGGQRCEIDAAGVGEIVSRERAGDRAGLSHKRSADARLHDLIAQRGWTLAWSVRPSLEQVNGFGPAESSRSPSANRCDRRAHRIRSNGSGRGRSSCSACCRRGMDSTPSVDQFASSSAIRSAIASPPSPSSSSSASSSSFLASIRLWLGIRAVRKAAGALVGGAGYQLPPKYRLGVEAAQFELCLLRGALRSILRSVRRCAPCRRSAAQRPSRAAQA